MKPESCPIKGKIELLKLLENSPPYCQEYEDLYKKLHEILGETPIQTHGNQEATRIVYSHGYLMWKSEYEHKKNLYRELKSAFNLEDVENIIEEDLKLVLLDGQVVARSETGFQLCEVSDEEEVVHHDDACVDVLLTENTVVQDDLIDIVSPMEINDGDFVTVLGQASQKNIGALHVVLEGNDKAVSNLALFTGDVISDFDVDQFMMDADEGDNGTLMVYANGDWRSGEGVSGYSGALPAVIDGGSA